MFLLSKGVLPRLVRISLLWLFIKFQKYLANHFLLLMTFLVFFAISTYNSYLPSIFGTNALIWGYFWNVRKGRVWVHWGQSTINVEFCGCNLEILWSFLKVWLPVCSKDWWEVWIGGRDDTKTKSPQQWGVPAEIDTYFCYWDFYPEGNL